MLKKVLLLISLGGCLSLMSCARTTSDTESTNTTTNSSTAGTPPGANGETAPNSAVTKTKAP
ncbi:MAG: hypothetical protein U0931_39695 [Vulcanimicrobiota bacterium]